MKKKTTVIISIILAAAIIIGAVILVLALNSAKGIKVGVLNGKPMSYKSSDGSWEGYDIDFANKIFGDLGYKKIEFVEVTCINREKMLEKGEIDCYMSGTDLEEDERFIFSDEYIESAQVLFYKKGTGIDITSNDELKSYRIGVLDDSENLDSIREYVDASKILEFATNGEIMKMLVEDWIDIAIIDYMQADYATKNVAEYKDFMVGTIYDTSPHAIILPAKKTKLQAKINEKMAEYEQYDYFDTLKEAHFMQQFYY